MKLPIMVIILLGMLSALCGYQNSSFSLVTPTELFAKEGELSLAHRFYGTVTDTPLDTFFGMDDGANVSVSTRYNIVRNIEAKAGYTRATKQYDLGASMRFTPSDFPVQAQVDVQYYSFVQPGVEKRCDNFLYLLSAQSKKYFERVSLAVNAGYDGYYERLVNGYGVQVKLNDKFTLLGEYYPVWDRNSASAIVARHMGANDAFAFGIKADTYGHQFMFSLGNGSRMNPAGQSMGTDNTKLHLGFNIQRHFGM